MTRLRLFLVMSAVIAILLAGCGLSSEPEIAQEIAVPTAAPQIVAPLTPPDLAAGATFYAAHCANCHGATGQGDGSLVQSGQLQSPPPVLTDPGLTQARSPLDYMKIVTDGNMLAGMPPFGRYSLEERWNVTAFVYTGAVTADDLTLGAAVYEVNCASCHGDGTGNGPEAPEIMPDLTSLDFWAENTNQALYQRISAGVMPGMPAFGDQLSEAEIRAAVSHIRALAVLGTPGLAAPQDQTMAEVAPTAAPQAAAAVPEATEVAAAPAGNSTGEEDAAPAAEVAIPEAITVTGRVTNMTEGGPLPEGASITLHMFDMPDLTETTLEGVVAADGTYSFTDVPHKDSRVYILSLQYQEVFFSTTVYELTDPANPALDTLLEIFETTTDPAVLTYSAGVMRITFSSFGMEVAQVLSVTNNSDRVFLTEEAFNENQKVVLRIPLPPGSGAVAFEAGMQDTRFFTDENETLVIDTQPVRPGRVEVFFSYLIPYSDGAIIEQEVTYPFQGPFHLLIESDQVTVSGELFTSAGQRIDMGGQAFDAFVAEMDLAAGEAIQFTVTGVPQVLAAQQGTQEVAGGGLSPVVVAVIVIGVVFIGAAGFLFLMRQGAGGSAGREAAINDLLAEIADLDDQHDQGTINHDVYQRTRAELKDKLAALMREDDAPRQRNGS